MVRKARTQDIEELNEASKESWVHGFSEILSEEDLELARNYEDFVTEEKLEECIDSDRILMLVDEREGKVVGKGAITWNEEFAHEFTEAGEEAQLRSMYVHPDYWGRGIGSELVEKLIERTPEKISAVKVEALKGSDAVKFYRKHGFRKISEGKLEADELDIVSKDYDTVVMEKRI